jgi:DNA-binding IclR family transcriptional regulator
VGLRDCSSFRQHSPGTTTEALLLTVIVLQRRPLTLSAIASQLSLSRSSVARICRLAARSRPSERDPVPYYPRYERVQPGEVLHLDVKRPM